MAKEIKSSKTGKVYTYADDVSDDNALWDIDNQEKDATYSEALSTGASMAKSYVEKGLSTLWSSAAKPFGGWPTMEKNARRADETLDALAKRPFSPGQEFARDVVAGVLPSAIVAPVTAIAAPVVGTTAALVGSAGVLGAVSGGENYYDQKEAGLSTPRAAFHATVHGSVDGVLEAALPLKFLLGAGGRSALHNIFGLAGVEAGQEFATEIIQKANAAVSNHPEYADQPISQWLKEAGYAGLVGAVGGTAIGGGMHVATRVMAPAQESEPEFADRVLRELNERLAKANSNDTGNASKVNIEADAVTSQQAEAISVAVANEDHARTPSEANVTPAGTVEYVVNRIAQNPDDSGKTILANIQTLNDAQVEVDDIIVRAAATIQGDDAARTAFVERAKDNVARTWTSLVETQHNAISANDTRLKNAEQALIDDAAAADVEVTGPLAGFAQSWKAAKAALDNSPSGLTTDEYESFGFQAIHAAHIAAMSGARQRSVAALNAEYAATDGMAPDYLPKTIRPGIQHAHPLVASRPNSTVGTKLTYEKPGAVVTFGPNKGKMLPSEEYQTFKQNAGDVDVVDTRVTFKDNPVDHTTQKRIAAILRKWTKTYLPNSSFVVYLRRDTAGEKTLGSLRTARADGDTMQFELTLTVMPDTATTLTLLSHEFGHAMFTQYLRGAPIAVRKAVNQHWMDWVNQNWNVSVQTSVEQARAFRKFVYSPMSVGESLWWNSVSRANDKDRVLFDKPVTYDTNFNEYVAHFTERMFAADFAGMQAPVKTFWRQAYARLKKFFTSEHYLWDADQNLLEWVQSMGEQARLVRSYNVMNDKMTALERGGLDTGALMLQGAKLEAESAPISSDKQRQPDPFVEQVADLAQIFSRAAGQHGTQLMKNHVWFSEFWSKMLGPMQLLDKNLHVPGVAQFLDALRSKMAFRTHWTRPANIIGGEWEKLGTQANNVSNLLIAEAESRTWFSTIQPDPNNPGHYVFLIDQTAQQKYGITQDGAVVYSRVRDMFMRALDAMEASGKARIASQFADDPSNPQMQTQLDVLTASYENMRKTPYTPFSRFGQFYVKIKADDSVLIKDPITGKTQVFGRSDTIYFETFETSREAEAAMNDIKPMYSKLGVPEINYNVGKIHENVYAVRNLPPAFLQAIGERLQLSANQLQEYNELIKDLASDTSFVKHMKRKANVAGYSTDVVRGFSDYFSRFSNSISKVQTTPMFDDAMSAVRNYKKQLVEAGDVNTVKLDEFYNWMVRTRDYVMAPNNELASLKAFVTTFYLGFSIPTAVQNVTQLGVSTLPYLSNRFGIVETLNVMRKAVQDSIGSWKRMTALAADEKAMITYALESGFINESYATTLAQYAEGINLSRLNMRSKAGRAFNWYSHKALYMFQIMEETNRRITILAAYRLNRKTGFTGDFDVNAYNEARVAVEKTQNEYAIENRPEFMRGNKSLIFQFMHYVQNAIFQMSPMGDQSWKRLLLMQLAVAGLMGLPFADDLLNFGKFIARQFGEQFEPELMLRQLLVELNVQPDIILRGVTSHLGPFDVSYRYSLGRVVPGMEAIASNKRFTDALADSVSDVGGAGMSLFVNALKAASFASAGSYQRAMETGAPPFMKYVMQAMKASEEGGVIARNGAMLAPLETGEILGLGIGLQPRKRSAAMEKLGFESEIRNYWLTRQTLVRANMYEAYRTGDREAIADTTKAWKKYNKEVRAIDPKMQISGKSMRQSLKMKAKKAAQQTKYGTPHNTFELRDTIEEAFPQPSGEFEQPTDTPHME